MNITIRKRPSLIHPDTSIAANVHGGIHLWRSGGLGDVLFMEPAIRKLKAQYPKRKITLHAPPMYEDLYRFIGFDGFEVNTTGKREGQGIDLHWAVENHPGWYSLDRVSMWEDILGVPIGDEPVAMTVPPEKSLLRPDPGFDKPTLAFLPFAAITGIAGRSLPGAQITRLIEALSEQYTVVLLHHEELPQLVKRTKAVCFEKTTLLEFMATLADCSKCLSVDTGGLYVAAALGVPSVGLYEHVPPWLRAKRFSHIYSLYLRRPTCGCLQHHPCTCPEKGEAPCKFFDPQAAQEALSMTFGNAGRMWAVHEAMYVSPLQVAVRIWGEGDVRATQFSLAHALAGIPWYYGAPDLAAGFSLGVKAGDLISRKDALKSLSDLQQPGFTNLDLPIDMRKHDRP